MTGSWGTVQLEVGHKGGTLTLSLLAAAVGWGRRKLNLCCKSATKVSMLPIGIWSTSGAEDGWCLPPSTAVLEVLAARGNNPCCGCSLPLSCSVQAQNYLQTGQGAAFKAETLQYKTTIPSSRHRGHQNGLELSKILSHGAFGGAVAVGSCTVCQKLPPLLNSALPTQGGKMRWSTKC